MSEPAIVTGPARDDLFSIREYLADHASLEVADRVITAARAEIDRLARAPGIGFVRESFAPPAVRFWRVSSFYIVDRWEPKPSEILRIVHAARGIRHVLGDGD